MADPAMSEPIDHSNCPTCGGARQSESIQQVLAREAAEAEVRADAEERGEIPPAGGQHGRRRAADPSQVLAHPAMTEPIDLTEARQIAWEIFIDEEDFAAAFDAGARQFERAVRDRIAADIEALRVGPVTETAFAQETRRTYNRALDAAIQAIRGDR
jgi:hypothetical protein